MDNSFKINKNLPALDIGTGLGEFIYNILPMGIEKIYANDLDEQNLTCVKQSLTTTYPKRIDKIVFLTGNFISKDVESKITNNSLGFINAKNIIHYLSFEELLKFTKIANQKLVKDGYLFVVFENKYLNDQIKLAEHINKQAEETHVKNLVEWDALVKRNYEQHSFGPLNLRCSAKTFENTQKENKIAGFPCQINKNEQLSGTGIPYETYQLIIPKYFVSILEENGFKNIKLANLPYSPELFLVLAQKG